MRTRRPPRELQQSPVHEAGDGVAAGRVEHVERQPGAQPHLEQHPLDPAGLRVERLAGVGGALPGGEPLVQAAGCLTFHHRTPPTCECAPGPTPHQLSPVQ